MDWTTELSSRVTPAAEAVPLEGAPLMGILAAVGVAVLVEPIWRVLRIVVTLVHELGHAFVGVMFGRKFTGFVVRGDMSGHAVTVGPARGVGRIATTWAGYPMPALVGAAMVVIAGAGWSAAFVCGALLLLVIALVRVRSALTCVVMVAGILAVGALWWWRDDELQAHLLVGVGLVLLIGAWRHLFVVASAGGRGAGSRGAGSRGDRSSDPAVLAQLSWLPRWVWVGSFFVTLAGATWFAGRALWPAFAG